MPFLARTTHGRPRTRRPAEPVVRVPSPRPPQALTSAAAARCPAARAPVRRLGHHGYPSSRAGTLSDVTAQPSYSSARSVQACCSSRSAPVAAREHGSPPWPRHLPGEDPAHVVRAARRCRAVGHRSADTRPLAGGGAAYRRDGRPRPSGRRTRGRPSAPGPSPRRLERAVDRRRYHHDSIVSQHPPGFRANHPSARSGRVAPVSSNTAVIVPVRPAAPARPVASLGRPGSRCPTRRQRVQSRVASADSTTVPDRPATTFVTKVLVGAGSAAPPGVQQLSAIPGQPRSALRSHTDHRPRVPHDAGEPPGIASAWRPRAVPGAGGRGAGGQAPARAAPRRHRDDHLGFCQSDV